MDVEESWFLLKRVASRVNETKRLCGLGLKPDPRLILRVKAKEELPACIEKPSVAMHNLHMPSATDMILAVITMVKCYSDGFRYAAWGFIPCGRRSVLSHLAYFRAKPPSNWG
eukprot:3723944-Amphidinium_carterae.1